MPYSLDLRERAVRCIRDGASVEEAATRYEVSRATLYRWLKRPILKATVVSRRHRKLDAAALKAHVAQFPDARLSERAMHFQCHPSSMSRALKRLKITHKKTASLPTA